MKTTYSNFKSKNEIFKLFNNESKEKTFLPDRNSFKEN